MLNSSKKGPDKTIVSSKPEPHPFVPQKLKQITGSEILLKSLIAENVKNNFWISRRGHHAYLRCPLWLYGPFKTYFGEA